MSEPTTRFPDLPGTSQLGGFDARKRSAENATAEGFTREVCVPQLATAQAAANPHRRALVDRDEVLSYSELDRRANQVAQCLRSLGVGLESVVGIY
jgi:non-ribosomal peptide synthetase component F